MTTQPPSVDRVGQKFGPYEITKFLGRGGFADVFLGRNSNLLEQQVAIKVLDKLMIKADKVQQFKNEAAIILSLHHPSIIRFFSYDIYSDPFVTNTIYPYIVMEYAAKGSLRRNHPRGWTLPLETIVNYSQQIASALQYAHGSQVIHLDVKPENILINNQGKLLLSDFGLAMLVTGKRPEDIQGTLSYMAPEQMNGNPDKASDQYSLAVMVYEWICGSLPFTARSFDEYIEKLFHEPPPSLLARVPTLPPAVEAVVMKALSKNVRDRYPSVLKFAEQLEKSITSPEQAASSPPDKPASATPRAVPASSSKGAGANVSPAPQKVSRPAKADAANKDAAAALLPVALPPSTPAGAGQKSLPPPEPVLPAQAPVPAPPDGAPAVATPVNNQPAAIPDLQAARDAADPVKATPDTQEPTPFLIERPPTAQPPAANPDQQGQSPFLGGMPPDAQPAISNPVSPRQTPFLGIRPLDDAPAAPGPDQQAQSPFLDIPLPGTQGAAINPDPQGQVPMANATPPDPQAQAATPPDPTQSPFLKGKPPLGPVGATPNQQGYTGGYSSTRAKSPFLGANSSVDLSPGEVKFGPQPGFTQSQTFANFTYMDHPGPPSLPPYLGRPGNGAGDPEPNSFQEMFSQTMHHILLPRRRRRRTSLLFFAAIIANLVGSIFIGVWLGRLVPSTGNELAWWGIILSFVVSVGAFWLFDYSGNKLLKVALAVILAFIWSITGFAFATLIGAGTSIGFLPDANVLSILFLFAVLGLCIWKTFRRA